MVRAIERVHNVQVINKGAFGLDILIYMHNLNFGFTSNDNY